MTGPFRDAAVGCLFKGGLSGDKSSSESQTTNTTTTQDNKVVAGDNSFVVTAGAQVGDVTVENLDADLAKSALENMTKVSGAAFDASKANVDRVLDYAGDAGDRAFDFAEKSGDRAFDFASDTQTEARALNKAVLDSSDANINRVSEAFKAAASGSTAQLQDTLKQIAIAGLVTAGAVGAIYVWRKK